jgi:hypothetical protein
MRPSLGEWIGGAAKARLSAHGGLLEYAQQMAAHESARTTKL